jgi:hypothetical protein
MKETRRAELPPPVDPSIVDKLELRDVLRIAKEHNIRFPREAEKV